MAKRTRADYEMLIRMAYDGFIGDSIGAAMNRSAGNVSVMTGELGLTLNKIRTMKREGKPLAQIISEVDWSFLAKKEEVRKAQAAVGAKNLAKYKASKPDVSADIADIKQMVTDIYDMLTKPADRVKHSGLKKIANGIWNRPHA